MDRCTQVARIPEADETGLGVGRAQAALTWGCQRRIRLATFEAVWVLRAPDTWGRSRWTTRKDQSCLMAPFPVQ
jgi:hypothetical protein